jgi:hypothetical protein
VLLVDQCEVSFGIEFFHHTDRCNMGYCEVLEGATDGLPQFNWNSTSLRISEHIDVVSKVIEAAASEKHSAIGCTHFPD